MAETLAELEQSLGYRFTDRELLVRALTHSSTASEAPSGSAPGDNERLEFLGDSVLGLLVSEWLFATFPEFNEGQLSFVKNHLVSANHLLEAAHRLNLGKHLQLGRGEETTGGRSKQRLLVNAFEAVLAAVYLDAGAAAVRDILMRHAIPAVADVERIAGAGAPHDFRAELERLARDRNLPRPQYVLLSEAGPGHARSFVMEVRVGREITASGEGSSKKAAAHNAARQVCRILTEETGKSAGFEQGDTGLLKNAPNAP